MYNNKNEARAFFKVEPKMGNTSDWVAMVSHDSTGTEYFYGPEQQCWDYIDKIRSKWKATGIDLVQQAANT